MKNRYISKITLVIFIMLSLSAIANSVNDTTQNTSLNINLTYNETAIPFTTTNNTPLENVSVENISSKINELIHKKQESTYITLVERNNKYKLSYENRHINLPIFKVVTTKTRYYLGTTTIAKEDLEDGARIQLYDSIQLIDSIIVDVSKIEKVIEVVEEEQEVNETNSTKTNTSINITITNNETNNSSTLNNITNKTTEKTSIYIDKTSRRYHLDNEKKLIVNITSLAREISKTEPKEIIHVGSKLINTLGEEKSIVEERTQQGINITINESLEPGSYSLVSSIFYNNKSHVHSIPLLVKAIKLKENKLKLFNTTYKDAIATYNSSKNTTIEVEETIINRTTTKVKPLQGVIKELLVHAQDITTLENEYIGLDTNITNLSGVDNTTFIQSYAIDPEQSNITTIDITATAKGNKLYKCVEWNFTTQTCYGEWKFIQSIKPGEEYSVTIDAVDPAFGEVSDYLVMEWNKVTSVNDTWQIINLEHSYQRPVIVATPHYTSAGVPTVPRITNITQTSFELRLQDTGGGSATTRDVSYLVIEEGIWSMPDGSSVEAFTYTSTQTDHDTSWTPVQQTPTTTFTTPVVLGQVMSYNDTKWSVFWSSDGTQAGNPTSANIYTGKHVGQDPTITRNDEEIGVIIFESGISGNISNIEYTAYISSDNIQGITNSPPYAVNHPITFGSTPTIGIASTNGMDGANGGWPVFYNSMSTTQARFAYDEYDSGERSHTAEPTGTIIFANAGNYSGNVAPEIISPKFNESIIEPLEEIHFSVNVTDKNNNLSVEYVQATFKYPNGSSFDANITQTTIGAPTETGDIETGIRIASTNTLATGETFILNNVNNWQTVTYNKTFNDPAVFAFNLNTGSGTDDLEQAMAIVTNISNTEFRVAVINASDSYVTDNVGVVVIEKGIWNISNTTVEVGDWTYSGTSFVGKTFGNTFDNTPSVYFQIQNNTDNWYAGRYTDTTLTTSGVSIQYEDGFNLFPETVAVSYIAFEQTTANDFFAGDIELLVNDDGDSGTWTTVTFPQTYNEPIMMGIISEAGTDPAKLGIDSLTSTSVGVRPIEETASDAEQAHSADDILWMVFNNSLTLKDETLKGTDLDVTPINYDNVDASELNYISSITVTVTIDKYNTTASTDLSNTLPSLDISLATDSGYESIGSISGIGNKSKTASAQSITTSWAGDSSLRDVRITGNNMDYVNDSTYDSIEWSNVHVSIQAGNKTVEWTYLFSDTGEVGTYNLTQLETYDGKLYNSSSYSSISFEVQDQTPPTLTHIYNITIGDGQTLLADFDAMDYSGLSIWSVNDTSNFTIDSAGTLYNATNLSIGVYSLNISVNDTYNNIVWDIIWVNVTNTPDTTPPEFVPNLTITTQAYGLEWTYDINATDDRGIIGEYWINDTLNFVINSETGELSNTTTLSLGEYTINVSVNDSSNNINTSELIINITDQIAPQFSISSPIIIEYGVGFSQQLGISDDVQIDNISINDTNFTINNSGYIENATLIERGEYNISLLANDTSGNQNATTFIIRVVDTTQPNSISNLESSVQEYTWIYWNWTQPTDADFSHHIIYLDGSFYSNTTNEFINITGLMPSTEYTIVVHTVDNDENINNTNVTNVSATWVNNIPEIIINSPINLSASLDTFRVLNVSASDVEEGTLCLSIKGSQSSPVDNQHLIYRDCNYANNTEVTYNWSRPVLENISSAEVLWHFDTNSDYGESATIVHDFAGGASDHSLTCSGSTCPSIISGAIGDAFDYNSTQVDGWPLTDQFFNDQFTTRSYQLWFKTDNTTGIHYLYEEGGSTNGLAFKINSGTLQAAARTSSTQYTASTTFTDTTNWHFLVVQYDNGNLSMYLDGSLVDSIDTSATFTTILAHSDEGYVGSTTGGGAFGTESGSFDGQIDEFRITTTALSESEIFNLSGFATNTTYYWNVHVNDSYSEVSKEVQFLVQAPTADMTLLNVTYDRPIEGVNTTVFAYVNNTGTTSETNVLVEFLINNSLSINKTISSINPGEIQSVNISNLFELGSTPLNVTVDINNQIVETNENNNEIDINVDVSSWHTYYGIADLDILLGNANENRLYSWFENNATGMLYVVDSDASVNFANVHAIGQNITDENSSNDFAEIDDALNLSGRYDSISNLFSLNPSTAIKTRNYSINGFNITYVPVVNSTNSSSFETGIMWDASSDSTGEYDENETLIFVTTIEDNLIGMYGTYDYEIIIPSKLQRSEGITDSLDVYVELQ